MLRGDCGTAEICAGLYWWRAVGTGRGLVKLWPELSPGVSLVTDTAGSPGVSTTARVGDLLVLVTGRGTEDERRAESE